MEKVYKILPKYAFLPIICCLVLNVITYFGSRLFTTKMYHYNISIGLDEMLPLVTPMSIIYVFAYVTWALGFIIVGRESRQVCYEVCAAEMVAKIICLVCFVIFPTTLVRPEITGTGFCDSLTSLIYKMDAADNLFPSIHCLESWILFCGIMKCNKQGKPMKIFMFVSAILVFASTVLIKQHVVLDIVGGILAVHIGLWVSKKFNLKRIFDAVENRIYKRKNAMLE